MPMHKMISWGLQIEYVEGGGMYRAKTLFCFNIN